MNQQKLWDIGIGITPLCNMHCTFCYSKKIREKKELTLDQWKKFLDKNAHVIGSINYGTGENTLEKKWYEFQEYVRETYPHIRQALTTNGYISDVVQNSQRLSRSIIKGIDEIDVSLDFFQENLHNDYRKHRMAYTWSLNTLKFCCDNGILPTIVVVGTKQTLTPVNLDGIFKIAQENKALVRINLFRPTWGFSQKAIEFIPDINQILTALYHIESCYKVLGIYDTLFSPLLTGHEYNDPIAKSSLRILPNGNITPSTYLITPQFATSNVKECPNLSLVSKHNIFTQFVFPEIPAECDGCENKNFCKGGSLDRRQIWYNSLSKRDPYCPKRFDIDLPLLQIRSSKCIVDSVHARYLPTMFFSV